MIKINNYYYYNIKILTCYVLIYTSSVVIIFIVYLNVLINTIIFITKTTTPP